MPELDGSLGEQVIRSAEYPRGSITDYFEYPLHIPIVGGLEVLQHKTLVSTANAGALIPADYHRYTPPLRSHLVLDIIPRAPTNSNRVFYVQQTSFTDAAAPVLEGEVKPESAITYQQLSTDVTTISTWIPVSNRMLADSAVLEKIIDIRLVHALNMALQGQILTGNGANANLLGILNTPGINAYTSPQGESSYDSIRHAATLTAMATGMAPTALVMHPLDLEDLELDPKLGSLGMGTMQRLEVLQTLSIPQGTALLGVFDIGCILFDRHQGSVNRGLHDDDFVRNIQVLRAELDVAFAVLQPEAFTRINNLV